MPDQLSEIRARLEDATPGPWHAIEKTARWGVDTDKSEKTPSGWERPIPINDEFRDGFTQEDAEFIANAPEDVAFLLSEVDRLYAKLLRTQGALREAETEIEVRDSALGDGADDTQEIRNYAFGDEHDLHPGLGKVADRMEGRLDRLARYEAAFAPYWIGTGSDAGGPVEPVIYFDLGDGEGRRSVLFQSEVPEEFWDALAPFLSTESKETRMEGPHSRACGISKHDHGPDCHSNCPTCGGRRG